MGTQGGTGGGSWDKDCAIQLHKMFDRLVGFTSR